MQQKHYCRCAIYEGLFRRQPGIDLIYERTTVFERCLNLDCIKQECASFDPNGALRQRLNATVIFWTPHNGEPRRCDGTGRGLWGVLRRATGEETLNALLDAEAL